MEAMSKNNCKELALDSEDENFSSDEDEEVLSEPTRCLFCTTITNNVDAALTHVHEAHGVSFVQLKTKFNCDQYSFIKLINCIRRNNITAQQLIETNLIFWNDEKYLKPKEYEPWLSYDYDNMIHATPGSSNGKESDADLHAIIATLKHQVKEQELLLQQTSEDMHKMREGFKRLIDKSDNESIINKCTLNCVALQSLHKDASYFSSYAHFGIHHEMLSDDVRTSNYRNALFKNKEFVKDKDVLDVGCGTSVLSIFASQAGAKSVVGIDNSDIIYNAMDIVNRNNISNVTLVKGRIEDTELPQDKYDIIISEWMGYFLLFEGMLDSVLFARDRYLKDGGILLPNRCTMSILGYGSDALFKRNVSFWNDVYGLDMSNMRKTVMHEPLIEIVDPHHILTEPITIADLNLATIDLNYSNFTCNFELICTSPGNLSAFIGYFDTFFELPEQVMFSTGPQVKPTHWKQVVFFIEHPQVVQLNDVIKGKLACERNHQNARSLNVTIEVFGAKYKYYLD